MAYKRWTDQEVDKMLDYRDQGLTEAKIADRLSIVFMRTFTLYAVNRKIRDLKKAGYLERNEHSGRFKNALGKKREGEKHTRVSKISKQRRRPRWDDDEEDSNDL